MTWPWGHRAASWGWPNSCRRFWQSGPQSPWPGSDSAISSWLLTWADALPGSRAFCSSEPRPNFLLRLIILSVEGTLATRRPRVPRQYWNFNFRIRGYHQGSIEFTWVQPPLLWAVAWAGHEECWGPGAWCVCWLGVVMVTQALWRTDDDQAPALCHECPPTVAEHHPDYIMKKNHSIMF